jgi:microcystin degradation protein MlrC
MTPAYRIAIAGFQHETNTFAPGSTGRDEFLMADSWPAMLREQQVISGTSGLNLPIAGAIATALQANVELIPIVWCAAEPGAPVTRDAFDWITGLIVDTVSNTDALDAIYLDLHGAMVTDDYQDGEAELLRRLREGPARNLPIGVSLDLHANVSPSLAELATLITVYRTYPHLDMADTGARCMQKLLDALNGSVFYTSLRQLPYLIPLHAQYTGGSPCQALYQQLDTLPLPTGGTETETDYNDAWLELAMGFTAADIYDCGPAVLACASNASAADQLADAMYQQLLTAEPHFDISLLDADHAVAEASRLYNGKPVVIADVQDNAGAGGTADTTGLLQAMIDARIQGAVLGVICDSDVAAQAHKAGIGQTIHCSVGAKSGLPEQAPVQASFTVEGISDGNIPFTGEMYRGVTACIGPTCLLALNTPGTDIRIVVSSYRTQCLDQAFFTHFGIDLTAQKIIAVKSTVHYRADFNDLAEHFINAGVPGVFACDLQQVDYKNLRAGTRLGPNSDLTT